MIRTAASRAMLLGLATVLVAGATVSSCSRRQPGDRNVNGNVGSIGLAIQLAGGATVNTVSYEITGNGITPIRGSIPVSDPGATVSVLVNGIPAGTGYRVDLTATSTDGRTTCAGSATFNVVAAQTTAVAVVLQCRGPGAGTGSASITGTFNNCPFLTSYSASPLSVSTGGTINVSAAASDLDPGAALTYAWTATGGSFAAAGTASTTYGCSAAGSQTLTIRVSDGSCDDSATIAVSCVAILCGNGTVDAGETCDDGNTAGGDACPADCTLPVCGDRVIEGAETCDDGNSADGDNCPADCTIPVCGDQRVEAPETCEPPNTATCDSSCRTIVVTPDAAAGGTGGGAGGGTGGAGGATGGTGGGAGGAGGGAGGATGGAGGATGGAGGATGGAGGATGGAGGAPANACRTCETMQCPALVGECENAVGNAAAGPAAGTAKRQLCLDVLSCIRTSNCASGQIEDCYCGPGVDPIGCITGMANGVCKARFEAAAESTSGITVSERFADPNFAVGNAVRLLQCDKEFCTAACFP